MLITFTNAYLVVCMAKFDRAEHCGFAKSFKQLGDMWNLENIKLCLAIQATVINVHLKFAGRFSCKQYRGSIQKDTRPYPPLFKQLFHLLLHFGLLSLNQSILPVVFSLYLSPN